uniref:Uncharacterized protein n=1 Tax=Meloidogyne enterolobii TaxID=390850 RepID=A0A6V7TP20_MELEN|nr:unnamed protein product [Meloidogyne enterolobii]
MHCDEISKEWENKKKNKKLKEFDPSKLENILKCGCNNLFSNWGDLETGQIKKKISAKDCLELLQILKPNEEISYSLQGNLLIGNLMGQKFRFLPFNLAKQKNCLSKNLCLIYHNSYEVPCTSKKMLRSKNKP